MQQRLGQQIILFPLPLQGHLNPMLQLANLLYSKGFSITIVHTQFNSPNPANHPNFTFHAIADGLKGSQASTQDSMVLVSLLNINCFTPFHDWLSELLSSKISDGESITCLITDAIWHFAQGVADRLNIPRLVLKTSSVSSFAGFAAIPLLLEKGYLPKRESLLEEPVPELPPLRVKDLPVIKTHDPEDFYGLMSNVERETNASAGIIWNTFEQLEETSLNKLRQEIGIPIFPVGPLHKFFTASSSRLLAQDLSSISWLNQQATNTVLYVSFGSLATITETEFLEIAWGLANSKQPFLWVVRPGLKRLKREEIEREIRRVMVENEGQEMRERIMYWKEKLNSCSRQGGSSYNYLESLAAYISSF
ncbi:hypothetical protein FEM48_Zijuj03G0074800 [Ziziphus jujuba var. spinosa]|uniref:UDP-glycosyltransferase 76B1-like n=1 Tax=Ziziphus jujuba var. spinosa TaxID=714518 RepID=A0A978VNZ3_ZIZJJ|nr:hypothetical protein FEM48_Zijuj03G0074800 [Ziziphus jujuba var. spinosa]